MRVERLLLRYSDGRTEWRTPAELPEIGTTVRRAGQDWLVAAIENDGEDIPVAILRGAPKVPIDEIPEVAPAV